MGTEGVSRVHASRQDSQLDNSRLNEESSKSGSMRDLQDDLGADDMEDDEVIVLEADNQDFID